MTFKKFAADFSDRAQAYATGNALQDLLEPPPDALTVFENGPGRWRIEVYFDTAQGERDPAGELAPLLSGPLPEFSAEEVPELNWVAISQAALPPVRAGRFTIHGSHDRARIARGPNTILIDAGEAFGTAHHATTLGCLLAIDRLARSCKFASVLDLGCGSGVLAIAVAKSIVGARIVAADMDAQSVKVAAENVRLNGVASQIRVVRASGTTHPEIRSRAPFDLLIANILAGPLIRLAPQLAPPIDRGGTLVLSGILVPQAPEVIATYSAHGFALQRHDRITGWSTLTFARR
ncbi:50S ribosomal protein L11 methyltransferase [Hyphomicrobium denitrificans 1NES1]|uniref:Ribosomal protein L11 methyltransferase n=1 Tax=Hyphomicrobium denitrificans 1NES1 TaxID=670307 RepID=N0B2Q2_9HYPH|nr:50S ribosomal protein L11 methyltransferase [Hyphomicrobium denitrificans]AGK56447.1 50S ribosomal protein L11 methyltransferase [Hyphomicrobium denitrificans 1NES1]